MSGRSQSILVVDDNPSNLKLFTFLLALPEYEVRTAANAAQAIEALDRFVPDLIIMDLQLPDVDGLTLTRQLKANPRIQGVPIVAVTASAMKGDEENARAAGVDGYMSKPVEKRAFRAMVAEYLGGKNRG
jgi:two-component system, cell cycle response regulator DivK